MSATSNNRYLEGQRIYLRECDPLSLADFVIDYFDYDNPRIVRSVAAGKP